MHAAAPVALTLLALLAGHAAAQAGDGFDMSALPSVSALQCMVNAGYTSFVFRAFRSTGTVDPNVRQAITNAQTAGLAHVDVYMFPCPLCTASASAQFSAMVSNLNGLSFGIVWLDVEEDSVGQYWSTSFTTNKNFYANLLAACTANHVRCGVYSNYNNWVRIFGSATYQATGGAGLPVWYAQYDGAKSFASYSAFGGWSTPNMKQYSGSSSPCGLSVDLNWFADASSIWSTNNGIGTACTASGQTGTCQDTTTCAGVNGKSTAGLCPGPSNVQCCTEVPCSTGTKTGICITTTACTADQGTSYPGFCPGASNIQCCVRPKCTYSGTSGNCMDTTSCGIFGGTAHAGLCPGASNIQCCVGA